jgi:hypothetical protein
VIPVDAVAVAVVLVVDVITVLDGPVATVASVRMGVPFVARAGFVRHVLADIRGFHAL